MQKRSTTLPTLILLFLMPILVIALTLALAFVFKPAYFSAETSLSAQALPNPEHVFLTGRSALDAEQYGLAEARIRAALAQDVNRPNWHNALGLALSKQGRFDEAIAAYETALSFDSKNAIYNYNLAVAYQSNNEVDSSVTMFKRVMVLAPDSNVGKSARRALQQLSRNSDKDG